MYKIFRKHRKLVEPVDISISRYHLQKSIQRSAETDRVLSRTERRIKKNHLAETIHDALGGPRR